MAVSQRSGQTQTPGGSAPCLAGSDDADIDSTWFGLSEHPPMRILAGNTIIYCSNWHETVAFYRDALGFRKTFVKDEWFMELRVREGCHISVADTAHCSIPAAGGHGLTLSFQVADLADEHKRLSGLGLELTPITSHSWRAPYFYVYDPAGTRIEMWNYKVDAPAI